ncbi:Rad52/Rad22 family DNA repair protein [Porticoccaceae bacterium]|nr:Rad52/Rad22 family DNA repair protein [Porticoccaceae bacterium]
MSIFADLAAPFPADQISWRPGSVTKDKSKGMALAYLNARNIMERLDEVVGTGGWQSKHEISHDGSQCICSIGIWLLSNSDPKAYQWVWKSDGAGKSDIEGEKGMISDALKRAAVSWGVGRYLYNLPPQWVELDEYKKFTRTPTLPAWALPGVPAPPMTEVDIWEGKKPLILSECNRTGTNFETIRTYMESGKGTISDVIDTLAKRKAP